LIHTAASSQEKWKTRVYYGPMSSTSDRAPDPRPARTRAAIFAAARELTAADGEVTVNALAKRAGVSRAAFYSHFNGLDDLMGAMFGRMYEIQHARSVEFAANGRSTQEMVQTGAATLVAYTVRHHAFLRGGLDWKFSHRTYMILVKTLSDLHALTLRRLGDEVPSFLPVERTARFFAGGTLAILTQWLVETEEAARAGEELDRAELTESVLRILPSWYTGLDPHEPIPDWLLAEDLLGPEPDDEA
jgi:AcrR family transcriptional regulator